MARGGEREVRELDSFKASVMTWVSEGAVADGAAVEAWGRGKGPRGEGGALEAGGCGAALHGGGSDGQIERTAA